MLCLFAETGIIHFHGGAAYGFILIVVSILLMLIGLLALPALIVAAGIFLLPAYGGFAALMIGIWVKLAGRYWINTHQARAVWPELEGYKLYLEQVDLDNIQFESTDHDANPVTKTLPYAMVFGLETKWRERLAKTMQPQHMPGLISTPR